MKLEKVVSGVWAFALSLCVSLGCVMCMVTAFDMQVDVTAIVICTCSAALLGSVCYSLPLGLVVPGVGALALGYLWQNGQLTDSVEALLNRLTRQYDRAYHWGVIRWGLRTADEMEPTIAVILCVLGAAIAVSICWSVCRGRTVLPGIGLSVLGASTCFVVTDTVPDVIFLYLLMLGILVLLLTGKTRQQEPRQGNRLTLWVTPITALALLALLAAVPQQTYHGQARADRLVDLFLNSDPVEFFRGKGTNGIFSGSENVDLSNVGRRNASDIQIMAVKAEQYSGVLYLRGAGMNAYDGKSWTDRQRADEKNWATLEWPDGIGYRAGTVTITTQYAHRILYTPYYINASEMQDATVGINNTEQLTEYKFLYYGLEKQHLADFYGRPGMFCPVFISSMSDADLWQHFQEYIVLPDSVRQWAEPLAREITGSEVNVYLRAEAIADYVRNSAVYDTNTDKMPFTQKDFARWFLESSDTGYCVHFATAATVLLQASGIPARFVTGYMTTVTAGETTPVLAKQSHAWTEYYLPGFGWTVLDATPASADTVPENTTQTTAPEVTVAPDRPDVTRPTAGVDDPENVRTERAPTVTVLVVIVAVLLLVVEGQYRLRRLWWQRRFDRCDTNGQAVLLWQQAVGYARALGQQPATGLFALAQMAKFSQHTITQAQLQQFADYLADGQSRLKKRSVFLRLWYRFVLALY